MKGSFLIGPPLINLVTPDDVDRFTVFLAKVARGVQARFSNRHVLFGWNLEHKGGILSASVTIHLVEEDLVMGHIVVVADRTRWKSIGHTTICICHDELDGAYLERAISDAFTKLRAACL